MIFLISLPAGVSIIQGDNLLTKGNASSKKAGNTDRPNWKGQEMLYYAISGESYRKVDC